MNKIQKELNKKIKEYNTLKNSNDEFAKLIQMRANIDNLYKQMKTIHDKQEQEKTKAFLKDYKQICIKHERMVTSGSHGYPSITANIKNIDKTIEHLWEMNK